MKEKKLVLKIILTVISILLIIWLINLGRKVYIINNIISKFEISSQKENCYWKLELTQDRDITTYKKGNRILTTVRGNNNKVIYSKNGKMLNIFNETDGKKTVTLNQEIINQEAYPIFNMPYVISKDTLNPIILGALKSKITTTKVNGKECYLIESSSEPFITYSQIETVQLYIEKETGLPIQVVNYDKKNEKTVHFYKYEFDNVTDENLKEPNINEYEILNKN